MTRVQHVPTPTCPRCRNRAPGRIGHREFCCLVCGLEIHVDRAGEIVGLFTWGENGDLVPLSLESAELVEQ